MPVTLKFIPLAQPSPLSSELQINSQSAYVTLSLGCFRGNSKSPGPNWANGLHPAPQNSQCSSRDTTSWRVQLPAELKKPLIQASRSLRLASSAPLPHCIWTVTKFFQCYLPDVSQTHPALSLLLVLSSSAPPHTLWRLPHTAAKSDLLNANTVSGSLLHSLCLSLRTKTKSPPGCSAPPIFLQRLKDAFLSLPSRSLRTSPLFSPGSKSSEQYVPQGSLP